MKKLSLPTLLIAGLVVVVLVAYACTFEVAFNEVAVKTRMGQADERSIIREPGLRLMWPLIESVQKYDTRLRTLDTPETEIKTEDGKNVIVGTYAVWRIADPLRFFTAVRSVDKAERQMRSRLSVAQAAVIGQSTLADFVNLDVAAKDASYDRMLNDMLSGAAPGLAQDFGIELKRIGVRRISLPKETTQQVFESMKQERNRLAARYRQEGKSRAEGIKALAESNANTILAFADARASHIESLGVAAATRIYGLISEADRPFFEWLRWLDALKASLAQRTTIFLDQNSPLFTPFVQPPVPTDPAAPLPAGSERADDQPATAAEAALR